MYVYILVSICSRFCFCLHVYQIRELKLKVQDLGGKFKKPALRKVRVSADEMMRALLGSKHKGSMDLRGNLKSVKKEDNKEVPQGHSLDHILYIKHYSSP